MQHLHIHFHLGNSASSDHSNLSLGQLAAMFGGAGYPDKSEAASGAKKASAADPAVGDTGPADAVAETLAARREPNYTTFGANVYDSSEEAFALGKKLYNNSNEAERCQTRNGNWIASFNLRVDTSTGEVELGHHPASADTRYFALNRGDTGYQLSKGYATLEDAAEANEAAVATFGVAVDDDNEVTVVA